MYKITFYFLLLFIYTACSNEVDTPEPVSTLADLSTAAADSITDRTASVSGIIIDDGGAEITEKGIVWSTSSNPSNIDNKVSSGAGLGDFVGNLTNLARNTEYFAKSYAVNTAGIAYGNEINFKTKAELAIISTIDVSEITTNSAKSGGNITDDGAAEITLRGVCWSINPNPTIENNKTTDGEGIGNFVSDLSELKPNTRYFIRAYAENSEGTTYGNELDFTTGSILLKTFEGDLILKTQEEVNSFGNEKYQVITGNLTIGDRFSYALSDITDLNPLNSLLQIGAKLDIWNNDNLDNLSGFENLNAIGGDFEINGNDKIKDLSGFKNLKGLGGRLRINGNDALQDVNHLQNIIPLAKDIWINRNDNLATLSSFREVTELNGRLSINNNELLVNLNDFSSLKIVKGGIELLGNSKLNDISGLNALTEVDGTFSIGSNDLESVNGFNELLSVNGRLSIGFARNGSLIGFNKLVDVQSLDIGTSLRIVGFNSLEVIKEDLRLSNLATNSQIFAFGNLSSVNGDISIFSSILYNMQFFANLTNVGGNFTISDAGPLGLIGLENLESIGGNFRLRRMPTLELKKLSKLTTIGGDLEILFNDSLRSVQFLNLESIGGDLLIEGNLDNIFNLDIPWGLQSIGGNLIVKVNNASSSSAGLRNLNAFQNLGLVSGKIELTDNWNLENYCAVKELAKTFTGTYLVSGNEYNPSQQDLIDGNCSIY